MIEKEAIKHTKIISEEVAFDRTMPDELKYYWAKGYLEASKKSKGLANALTELISCAKDNGHNSVVYELCVVHVVEAEDCLRKWEKDR